MIIKRQRVYSFRSDAPEEIDLRGIHLEKVKDSWFTRHIGSFISKILAKLFGSKNIRTLETLADYNILEGKTNIGALDLTEISKEELNVMWIEVDKDYRGRGFAQEVLKWVIKFAKERKYKTLTLEVPGTSPDARHIYEKLGFKEVGQISSPDEDFFWGGLTAMKKVL